MQSSRFAISEGQSLVSVLWRGTTDHVRRLAILLALAVLLTAGHDFAAGRPSLLSVWPAMLAIVMGIEWLVDFVVDFQVGVPKRMPAQIEEKSRNHPIGWYRAFVRTVVHPARLVFAYGIPISMLLIALSYFSGVLTWLAAAATLFMLLNMVIFRMEPTREDFILLVVIQVLILVTNPGGLPAILARLA